MALDRISLANFRNHRTTRLEGTAQFNLLIGENGAGKTNVLEAISLLAPGRGLRRAPLAEMAAAGGSGGFAVSALLDRGDGGDGVMLGTGTAPDKPGRRIVQVNGADASALSLGEWLALSWLTPAMDRLFSDSAGARRRYLDRLAAALDPAHARHAARYEAALRERNRLLGDANAADPRWFSSIEAQMAEAGAALAQGRARLVQDLHHAVTDVPDTPFARPSLAYVPGGPLSAEMLAAALAETRPRDLAAGRSLTGPHRDEFQVKMAEKGIPAAHCSTGEQKAMLIALTLAHAALAEAARPSLLLLDEVAAHLDPLRRRALFERLEAGNAQVWLTGTEREPFADLGSDAAIWRVGGGMVERLA